MIVQWSVDDGYIGNATFETEIPDEDIAYCHDLDDALNLIEEYVKEDFEMNIGWCFEDYYRMMDEARSLVETEDEDASN